MSSFPLFEQQALIFDDNVININLDIVVIIVISNCLADMLKGTDLQSHLPVRSAPRSRMSGLLPARRTRAGWEGPERPCPPLATDGGQAHRRNLKHTKRW
eukprot:scaffold534515_cov45-Prasinocladus_malaysianus.AAC.1